MTDQPRNPHGSPRDPLDDELAALIDGDDAFGGSVGDDLPGGLKPGRHRPDSPTRAQTAAAYGVPESSASGQSGSAPSSPADQSAGAGGSGGARASAGAGGAGAGVHPDTALAAERLLDLQRLQAEYVNYKKRVDRDRDAQRELAIGGVMESLLPVLDEIHLARQHGELEDGPFAKIAAKLETILAKYGVSRFGEAGETFDPMVHQALMHTQADLSDIAPGTSETTVTQVMQPGYKIGERVLRPAMVAVADPL